MPRACMRRKNSRRRCGQARWASLRGARGLPILADKPYHHPEDLKFPLRADRGIGGIGGAQEKATLVAGHMLERELAIDGGHHQLAGDGPVLRSTTAISLE